MVLTILALRKFLVASINILIFMLLLLALDAVLIRFPSIIPKAIVNYAPYLSPQLSKTRVELLEYSGESPFVKFKPNVQVDIEPIGFRGEDFVHRWATDELGFKNRPGMTKGAIDALAAGDSFVEGMGVGTLDTWTSIITDQEGITVYNMGIQGYAPSQITGTLRKYGELLRPQFVIFGYTPGFETRELSKQPQGGIAAVDTYIREVRAKDIRFFKVLNAAIDYLENYIFKNLSSDNSIKLYEEELSHKTEFTVDSLSWQLTRQSIIDSYNVSQKLGGKFVILVFYHRPTIYGQKLFGKNIGEDSYELVVVSEVKKLAKELGVDVIDTFEPLKSYVDGLPDPVDLSRLPYFKRDGHLNEIGQEIVAGAVIEYFRSK